MATEGMSDRPGEIHRVNKLPKAIMISGTTDGSGDFNVVHGLDDYTRIVGINAIVNWNGAESRDPVSYSGILRADSTKVYIGGSLAGNWATQLCRIVIFFI